MKSNILKSFLFVTIASGVLTSCVKDDKYDNIDSECITATPTKTVSDIYTLATAAPKLYTDDDIIEAYVTSSDEGGTFYKSISFQTLDGTKAFSIPVDMYNIYTEFEPGRKVYVNLKNRQYNITYGSLIIGDLYEQISIGRLVPEEFRRTVKASCESVSEEQLVQHLTITQALNNNNINKLIELDNVQFSDEALNTNYFNADNQIGGATNINIIDASGKKIIFRTSEFAKFAGHKVASGNGKIRGVLTKYNSDYQFLARTESDIKLTNPRIDSTPAIVGSDSGIFSGNFTENFESYAVAQTNFPKYINDALVGTRYWGAKTFGSNKYLEMTSFGAGGANKSYFMVPVDLTIANNFSFKSNVGYWNGVALKVYYILSADYIPGAVIDSTKLVDLSSNFTIPTSPTNAYGATFTNSGVYAIPPTLTGNGYFVFEYSGSTTAPIVTSTIQLDDITVN